MRPGSRVRLGQFTWPGAGQSPSQQPAPPPAAEPPPQHDVSLAVAVLSPAELDGMPGATVTLVEVRGEQRPSSAAQCPAFMVRRPSPPYDCYPSGAPPPPPPQPPAPRQLASGRADAEGRFTWSGRVAQDASIRVLVSSGPASLGASLGQASFPQREATVPVGSGGSKAVSLVVCPVGTDPLVCEVAELQLVFSGVFQHQLAAWNFESSGRPPQVAGFAADVAHAAVLNTPVRSPALRQYWNNEFSWFVTDLGIPPRDWPDLVRWYDQARRIFDSIPFPAIEGAPDLFKRCARGIPITVGRQGQNLPVANPRLYSATFSGYFPRSDLQVERDMAARYLMNIPAIFKCIDHKLRARAREVARSARTMSLLSLATTFMLAPMSGGAGLLSSIATEIPQFVMANYGAGSIAAEGVTASVAAGLIASGDASLVTAALAPLVEQQLAELDPVAQQAIRSVLPQVVDAAVQGVTSGTLSVGAADFVSLQGIGSALGVAMVKAVAAIPKLYAAKRAEEFGDAAAGVQQAAVDFLAMAQGEGIAETFRPFMSWAYEQLLEGMLEEILRDFYDAVGQAGGSLPAPSPVPAPTPPTQGAPPDGGAPPPAPPPPPSGVPPPPGSGWPVPPGPETVPPLPLGSPSSPGLAVAGVGAGALALLLLTGVVRV